MVCNNLAAFQMNIENQQKKQRTENTDNVKKKTDQTWIVQMVRTDI